MNPTVSPYHRPDPGPDGLCRLAGCGRPRLTHLVTRSDSFRRLDDLLAESGGSSTPQTTALVREIVHADAEQSWPPRSELSDLQKALVLRAVNTEINLLKRLYGVSSGTVFSFGSATFAEQVAALEQVQDWLYPSEDVNFGLPAKVPSDV